MWYHSLELENLRNTYHFANLLKYGTRGISMAMLVCWRVGCQVFLVSEFIYLLLTRLWFRTIYARNSFAKFLEHLDIGTLCESYCNLSWVKTWGQLFQILALRLLLIYTPEDWELAPENRPGPKRKVSQPPIFQVRFLIFRNCIYILRIFWVAWKMMEIHPLVGPHKHSEVVVTWWLEAWDFIHKCCSCWKFMDFFHPKTSPETGNRSWHMIPKVGKSSQDL